MEQHNKNRLKIYRRNEKRSLEIARMIDEGGLGADTYYEIKKQEANFEGNYKKTMIQKNNNKMK